MRKCIPCPKCGSKAIPVTKYNEFFGKYFVVTCIRCDYKSNGRTKREDAIAEWNKHD